MCINSTVKHRYISHNFFPDISYVGFSEFSDDFIYNDIITGSTVITLNSKNMKSATQNLIRGTRTCF